MIISEKNRKDVEAIEMVMSNFCETEGDIRAHMVLSGPSGAGKTFTIRHLAEKMGMPFLSINAAQLTKEGLSGASLSRVMAPLATSGYVPTICLVDEFDKLFLSAAGNGNGGGPTDGVQDEFLTMLDGNGVSILQSYGEYLTARTDKVLFIFAGAFQNQENIGRKEMLEMGIRREFLGRVPLSYELTQMSDEELRKLLNKSELFLKYLSLYPGTKKATAVTGIMNMLKEDKRMLNLGVRNLETCVHRYFVERNDR